MDNKEEITRNITYKAILLYSLVGGCCIINIINLMETRKFNNDLQKQIKLCKKMIKNKKIIYTEA